jgi:hypothetical protein
MNDPSCACSSSVTDQEMRACIAAEIDEIQRYKWYLGERLRHDPLLDRSMDDICKEWIDKYAAEFRKTWESRKSGAASNPS